MRELLVLWPLRSLQLGILLERTAHHFFLRAAPVVSRCVQVSDVSEFFLPAAQGFERAGDWTDAAQKTTLTYFVESFSL